VLDLLLGESSLLNMTKNAQANAATDDANQIGLRGDVRAERLMAA
jgi:hypothetical protein